MTLAGSTSDRAKASRADVEYPSMARRNREEVVVADEIGDYNCVQRVVRRASSVESIRSRAILRASGKPCIRFLLPARVASSEHVQTASH